MRVVLYIALVWSANFFYFTALLEGIYANLHSHIQALKLYIYQYKDIYLKHIILALSWGAQK